MCAYEVRSSTAERLDAVLGQMQALGRVPSVSAGVVRGGDLAWCGGVGGVSGEFDPGPDVQYRIGSITKTFVAVWCCVLWCEGLVRLDDRVDRFITDTPFGDRTVQQLLTHTGGLSAEPPGSWWSGRRVSTVTGCGGCGRGIRWSIVRVVAIITPTWGSGVG